MFHADTRSVLWTLKKTGVWFGEDAHAGMKQLLGVRILRSSGSCIILSYFFYLVFIVVVVVVVVVFAVG
jgi:hypothetical protein